MKGIAELGERKVWVRDQWESAQRGNSGLSLSGNANVLFLLSFSSLSQCSLGCSVLCAALQGLWGWGWSSAQPFLQQFSGGTILLLQVLIWLLPLHPYVVTRLHSLYTWWWRQAQSFSAGCQVRWRGLPAKSQSGMLPSCRSMTMSWKHHKASWTAAPSHPCLALGPGKTSLCLPEPSPFRLMGAGCLLQVCSRLGLWCCCRAGSCGRLVVGNNSMTVHGTSWAGGQDVQQNVQDTHSCISMWKKTHVDMVCVYNACLKE